MPDNQHFSQKTSFRRFLQGGFRHAFLILGDIFVFYLSLSITLLLRYGNEAFGSENFFIHRYAFTFGLILWLIVFYLGGLYDRQVIIKSSLDRRFFPLVGIGGILLILLFYFVPSLGITPKTTLVLFVLIYGIFGYGWRMIFNAISKRTFSKGLIRVMILGSSTASEEVVREVSSHPGYGYAICSYEKEGLKKYANLTEFINELVEKRIEVIVIPQNLEADATAGSFLCQAMLDGVSVVSLADFYEKIFERISLSILDDAWLIRNLADKKSPIRSLGRLFEILIALILIIILSPVFLLVAILVTTTSKGDALYKQERVGVKNKSFTLLKFRSMYSEKERNSDADSHSAQWSNGTTDPRITSFGQFLRVTHLDELPQLYNILVGDMSFVGPRPERPVFTQKLTTEIPYYSLRSLIKPGIAGWAQLHYPYGASTEDAYQKLQYDIFYIKHKSLLLDLTIILKTIKRFFVPAQK